MILFSPRPRVLCAQCQASWRVSETETAPSCPACGSRDVRLAPFRFSLRTLALLGAATLFVAIVISGSAARSAGRRAGAAPSSSEEPAPAAAANDPAPLAPSRAGRVPCGFCNGDGRIDETDRYRAMPPFTSAPPGPCPHCAGKGGLSR